MKVKVDMEVADKKFSYTHYNVCDSYTVGGLYCILQHDAITVIKFPLCNIRKITEGEDDSDI